MGVPGVSVSPLSASFILFSKVVSMFLWYKTIIFHLKLTYGKLPWDCKYSDLHEAVHQCILHSLMVFARVSDNPSSYRRMSFLLSWSFPFASYSHAEPPLLSFLFINAHLFSTAIGLLLLILMFKMSCIWPVRISLSWRFLPLDTTLALSWTYPYFLAQSGIWHHSFLYFR